jgi:membrane associated rhomboid family serine protease
VQSPVSYSQVVAHLRQQGVTLGLILLVLWGAEMLDFFLRVFSPIQMDSFGIRPRTLLGIMGIPLAPILHVNFSHLLANTLPLLVLASLVLFEGTGRFWRATLIIILVGGTAVWCFGQRDSVYLGASGLVFGYMGFVFMRAWVSRRLLWIAIAIACAVFYGGLAVSLFSLKEGVSWLGHLSGFIAGMLAAEWLHTEKRSALVRLLQGNAGVKK